MGETTDPQVFEDPKTGLSRFAFLAEDGTLEAALFVGPEPVRVARDFVAGLLGQPAPHVLAANPQSNSFDPGPIMCACMSVGQNTLIAAMEEHRADLERVCQATGAGVTCGSCRPEIADLLQNMVVKTAAE